MRSFSVLGAVVVGSMVAASSASATMVMIQSNPAGSTDGLGRYTGSISYTSNTLNTGTLTIVLSNTNTPGDGGYITGLVFNIPGADAAATAQLAASSLAGFQQLGPTASASPYGTYEAGAALGGSWLGGGSPNGGVAVGQTGTFTFNITSAGASGFTASSFIASGSSPSPLVRFKGFANGGSDKVPGVLVPAPGAAALMAGAGLVAVRRRRR